MGHGPRYRVPWRRRREGKTNYYKRIKLIKSGKPRLVVRRTNKYIIVQVAEAKIEGDRMIAVAHSRELVKKYGWLGGTANTSAAYLTGLLAALRARRAGVSEAVLDIGLATPTPGSRVFAALKGALDAGLRVPHSPEILPGDDRIRGVHIAEWASRLSQEDPERYKRLFSQYLARGLKPEDLPKHFEEVVSRIKSEFSDILLEKPESVGGGEA
ncbi:MAG: 50S ribosomal protein L18 [Desulfurococcales archaeon]|nr:50S ribosomal protein L18 [Desulfurococcales archaeon]